MQEKIALVPGSFDPVTFGHIDIIRRAAELYDRVYVAVMINAAKNYLFTLEQRKAIAEAAVGDIPNVTVIAFDGMLWELAKRLGACAIVKGYRNEKDLAYEKLMAEYNQEHYSDAETVLLHADQALAYISSTLVREKLAQEADLSDYLPKAGIEAIKKILHSQN